MDGWVWAATVSGPLARYAAGFEQWLAARGFSSRAVPKRVWQFDHLSRWLEREGFVLAELTPARVDEFLAARRAAGYATWVSPLSMRLPLAYLREVGVVPMPSSAVADGPLERLLADYRRYLAGERGLVAGTIAEYERVRGCCWRSASDPMGSGSTVCARRM